MTNCKFVSELVGEDYKNWTNQNIILDCGTGSGKTTFVLEHLAVYYSDKSFLYLVNRSELYNQIAPRCPENVTLMTYQSLQTTLQHQGTIEDYDFYVADETHYVLSDATFNDYTDLTFKFLIDKHVIYMSATGNFLFDHLLEDGYVQPENHYILKKDYRYIKEAYYYNASKYNDSGEENDFAVKLVNDILVNRPDDKILFFCSNKERMKDMHKLFKSYASFYCSENASSTLQRICDPNCVQDETFNSRILFTTSALDNGVDLKDRAIKHIFCEMIEPTSMFQAIGRKRPLDEEDTCTVYLRQFGHQYIDTMLKDATDKLQKADAFRRDPEAFKQEWAGRNPIKDDDILYMVIDEGIGVNNIRYIAYHYKKQFLLGMRQSKYIDYMQEQYPDTFLAWIREINYFPSKRATFISYLEKKKYKKLFKTQQEELKEQFKLIGLSGDSIGRKTLNAFLEEQGLPYDIKRFRETKSGRNHGKYYWEIMNP